jgi:hypothetical protein
MGRAQRLSQTVARWFVRIFRAFASHLSLISVFALVAFWNISVSSGLFERAISGNGAVRDTAREIRDVNLHLQLRFYQLLTHLRPIPFRADNVSLAYIDDDTDWTLLYGAEPTDRNFLAVLIHNASLTRTKAAAIGVDIELLAPLYQCVDLSVGVAQISSMVLPKGSTPKTIFREWSSTLSKSWPVDPHLHNGPIKKFHCPHADQRKG